MSEEVGAGAGSDFQGARDARKAMNAEAGVVEGRPGILESTNLESTDPRDTACASLSPSASESRSRRFLASPEPRAEQVLESTRSVEELPRQSIQPSSRRD